MSLKEQAIREYIAKVNFKKDWSYAKIEEDMRQFLGERPALEISYKKDVVLINEGTKDEEAKEIKAIDKIYVVFKDLDNKFTPNGAPILTKIYINI